MNNKLKDGAPDVKTHGKDWPENNEQANFGDIADPVIKALKIAIKKGNSVYKDGINWTGLKQGKLTRASVFAPTEALHAKNLTYSKKEQGRDAITEIVSIAVQLGIEQGRRMVVEDLERYKFLFKSKPGKEIIESLIKT